MSIAFVTTYSGTDGGGGSPITINITNASGAFLIASAIAAPSSAAITWSTPANWTLLTANGANNSQNTWYRPNCPSSIGNTSFTWTGTSADVTVAVAEFSGAGSAPSVGQNVTSGSASPMNSNVSNLAAGNMSIWVFGQPRGNATPPTFGSTNQNQAINTSGTDTTSTSTRIAIDYASGDSTNHTATRTTTLANTWLSTKLDLSLATAPSGDEGEMIVSPQWQWRMRDHNAPMSRRGKRLHRKFLEEMQRAGFAA